MFNKKLIIILLSIFGIGAIIASLVVWLMGGLTAIYLQPRFAFEANQAAPALDYKESDSWAAFPKQTSFANRRPLGEKPASPKRLEAVDVFFVHPTSLLSSERWTDDPKRADPILNFGILRAQAGAFNKCCQVYAPRYRQATLWAFIGDEPSSYQALEFAYADVRRAFKQFLKFSKNRPFVLAGHSQGSLHAIRLLQEEIMPNKRLSTRMVAAYLVGYAVPNEITKGSAKIKPCAKPSSIRCYVNWNSVIDGYEGEFWRNTGRIWLDGGWKTIGAAGKLTCINPLSWKLNGGLVDKALHPGSLVVVDMIAQKMPALTNKLVSARCSNDGLLYISNPNAGYNSDMINNGDYHVYDYHLFYQPIRRNVETRINAFFKQASRN